MRHVRGSMESMEALLQLDALPDLGLEAAAQDLENGQVTAAVAGKRHVWWLHDAEERCIPLPICIKGPHSKAMCQVRRLACKVAHAAGPDAQLRSSQGRQTCGPRRDPDVDEAGHTAHSVSGRLGGSSSSGSMCRAAPTCFGVAKMRAAG